MSAGGDYLPRSHPTQHRDDLAPIAGHGTHRHGQHALVSSQVIVRCSGLGGRLERGALDPEHRGKSVQFIQIVRQQVAPFEALPIPDRVIHIDGHRPDPIVTLPGSRWGVPSVAPPAPRGASRIYSRPSMLQLPLGLLSRTVRAVSAIEGQPGHQRTRPQAPDWPTTRLCRLRWEGPPAASALSGSCDPTAEHSR